MWSINIHKFTQSFLFLCDIQLASADFRLEFTRLGTCAHLAAETLLLQLLFLTCFVTILLAPPENKLYPYMLTRVESRRWSYYFEAVLLITVMATAEQMRRGLSRKLLLIIIVRRSVVTLNTSNPPPEADGVCYLIWTRNDDDNK